MDVIGLRVDPIFEKAKSSREANRKSKKCQGKQKRESKNLIQRQRCICTP